MEQRKISTKLAVSMSYQWPGLLDDETAPHDATPTRTERLVYIISSGLYIYAKMPGWNSLLLKTWLSSSTYYRTPLPTFRCCSQSLQVPFPSFLKSLSRGSHLRSFEVHFPWAQHVTLRSAGSHVVATRTVAWMAKGDHTINRQSLKFHTVVCHGNLLNNRKSSIVCHFICQYHLYPKKHTCLDTR